MTQYWVVGAMFGGQDDQSEKFITNGYWLLGWKDADQPSQAKLRDQIRPGDRIAIKRMLGQGSKNIEICALGVVKAIDDDDGASKKRVYVNWLISGLNREVPSRGCLKSIHGPFLRCEDWTKDVFSL